MSTELMTEKLSLCRNATERIRRNTYTGSSISSAHWSAVKAGKGKLRSKVRE
jgi:hypothetical protein